MDGLVSGQALGQPRTTAHITYVVQTYFLRRLDLRTSVPLPGGSFHLVLFRGTEIAGSAAAACCRHVRDSGTGDFRPHGEEGTRSAN